jgi:tripartite ATP-independent transporter DctM subunit
MESEIIGIIGMVIFVILVLLGCWVGFAATAVGLIGTWLIKGWDGMGGVAGFIPYTVNASFELSVIPLFIIMGHMAYHAGLTGNLYRAGRMWFGHLRGGLAIATIFAAAGFGACTGSSTASAAIFAKVAVPEMKKYNYSDTLSTGSVASAGTLASLIPPSIVIVLYGILTEQSVGKLLIAGFIPGIIQAIFFSVTVWVWCSIYPESGKALDTESWRNRFSSLKGTSPMVLLIIIMFFGLYAGVFTPTEAGGIGAFVVFLLATFTRKLTLNTLKKSLIDTGNTTAMIFATLLGVMILLRFFALSGVTISVTNFLLSLPVSRYTMLFLILGIYLVLGMLISAIGMMMLTVPFVFPVIVKLGFDPLWFGIIVVVMCEIAFLTPPVAMNIYAVKAMTPDISIETIIKGIVPFLLVSFLFIVFLIIFPDVVLWLPKMME